MKNAFDPSLPLPTLHFSSHHVPLHPLCLGPRQGHGKEYPIHIQEILDKGRTVTAVISHFLLSPCWLLTPGTRPLQRELGKNNALYLLLIFSGGA